MLFLIGATPLVFALWWLYRHDEDTHALAVGIIGVVLLLACTVLVAEGVAQITTGGIR